MCVGCACGGVPPPLPLPRTAPLTQRKHPLPNTRPLPPQLRAYTHLTESLMLPSTVGEAVHQSLVQANAFGLGDKYIASLITAQEKLTGLSISAPYAKGGK